MSDGRIGCGDVVVTVQFFDGVTERTTHDEPHHHLDALGPRLAQVFEVRDRANGVDIFAHVIEKSGIEFLVDESRSGPLELVAHAARSPHLHPEVLIEGLHRAPYRPTELVAALPGRWGILHDVDRQWDDLRGPGVRRPVD